MMETRKQSLDRFYDITKQVDLANKCISEQAADELIMHLMHDELDMKERSLVEEHRLYDWLFIHYYTEEEMQIRKLFAQMAEERKTAIYGKGAIARFLLNCGFYQLIAGVLAQDRTGTLFCGKEIISEGHAFEAGITQIVVAAKVGNYQVITERIAGFCEENGILLRGLNGINLLRWYGVKRLRHNSADRKYLHLDFEKLRVEIDKHDVISFDVFDTLIMRKVLHPTDVFYIVGCRLAKDGILPAAFADKRDQADRHNRYEKNIFGIYRTLQDMMALTDEERDRIMDLEIGTEMQMAVCRKDVVEAFRYALAHGKRVFLISDMHLTGAIISKILSGVGIEGYEKLLVSCDYNCGKTSGLFKLYKEMVPEEGCLHIGDNEVSDGAASKYGIDVFLIRSAVEMLKASNLKALEGYVCSVKEKSALGLLLSEVFNSPFALHMGHGVMQVGTYKEWGYRFLGIYVTSYIDWLVRELKESKIEKMLFSTRDGYLFYNLYNWYRDNVDGSIPEAVYVKISRRLCYLASMSDEKSIDFFLNYDDVYAPAELLEKRFLMEKSDILPYSGEDRREYVMRHKEKIFQKAAMVRKNYFAYMNDMGIRENGKYGFFDSYCSGSAQYLMEQFVPFELHGLYLGKIYNTRKLKSIESFYEDKGGFLKTNDINDKRTLMEYCFSSPETNIIGMGVDGKFLYAKEYRTDRDIRHMLDIQEGIKEFFIKYHSAFPIGEGVLSGTLANAAANVMDLADLTGECRDIGVIRSIDDMDNKGYAVWEK